MSDHATDVPGAAAARIRGALLWLPLAAALAGLAATFLLWRWVSDQTARHLSILGETQARSAAAELQRAFESLKDLLARVARGRGPALRERSDWHIELTGLELAAWIEPSGEVLWVTPRESDESLAREGFPEIAALAGSRRGDPPRLVRSARQPAQDSRLYLAVPVHEGDRLAGFLLGVFSARDLYSAIFSDNTAPGWAITIREADHEVFRLGTPADGLWVAERSVELGDVARTIHVGPRPEVFARLRGPLPEVVLGGGAAIALLLAASVGFALAARGRAHDAEQAQATLRQSERQLRAVLERYRALMEQANDAILILEPGQRVVEANARAVQLLGRPRLEIVGRHYDEFVAPDEKADSARRREQLLTQGTLRVERRQLLRADGTRVSVEISAALVLVGEDAAVLTILRDITERQRAEEAVRRKEARLQSVLDAALDAVVMMDEQGLVVSWNARAEELFGWARDEAIGKTLSELIIPARYREAHTRGLKRFLATGEGPVIGRRIELSALRRDGSEFPVELTVTAQQENGAFLFSAFVADISERKLAEEKLRQAQQRLQHVVSSSPAVLYSLKVEGEVLVPNWVSDNIEHFTGYRAEAVSSPEWWLERLHPEDRERVTRQVTTLLSRGQVTREYRFRHRDGTFRWVRDEQVLVRDAAGEPEVVGSWSDITARKEAELRLQQSEEQYRLLFDSNPHPMWVFDEESLAFLAVNDAAVRNYGWSRDEFLAMTIGDIQAPDALPRMLENVGRSRWDRQTVGLGSMEVWQHRKKDGTRIDVEGGVSPIVFQGHRAWLTLAADITERKSLEAQLLQVQKMESIGRLAGGVAHDFNNLLGVIGGYAELLRKRVGEDARLRKYADDILKAVGRAAGLTHQLLAFSRRQVLQPRILDLNLVVGDMEKMLRRVIGEDIQLVTVFDASLAPVKADPGQMEQVLMNLAVNARDAMPQGGRLTIETGNVDLDEFHARHRPDVVQGRYVMLAVSDTGHGMTPEVQAKVFDPFFTTKEPGKGTGLGLATAHGIVKQSGGHIWVYSEPQRGTTFKIYLPRAEEAAEQAEAETMVEELPRGSETVLLVEDEAALRDLIRECLESAGYVVLEAHHGAEALELYRSHGPRIQLLITDVVMPMMSGRELASQLSESRPEMRVLYMSGYTDDAVVLHGVLSADVAFLQKPFTAEALARKVREVLDSARA